MNTKETLQAMHGLLSTNWTQGTLARTKSGAITGVHSKNACSFCLLGAYRKVSGTPDQKPTIDAEALKPLRELVGSNQSLMLYNDEHSQSQVLHLLEVAIGEQP